MLCLVIIQSVILFSLAGGGRSEEEQQTEVAILKQVNRVNDDGSYTFGYEAADGSFKIETRDVQGNVKGMFGYVDTSGELKKVSYSSSNTTGFQTTENAETSASDREALLSSFGTPSPSPASASDRSDRKPILVLRDSALLGVTPTKSSFIQYIPKKAESSSIFGAREFSTPGYDSSTLDPESENYGSRDQNEDLFVNPDSPSESNDVSAGKRFKFSAPALSYPRKIVVTRRPVENGDNGDHSSISRGGNALRRQLSSRRLSEREEDGVHVYGNELMNSNYYDKPMDAHTMIQENTGGIDRNTDSYSSPAERVRYETLEPKYRENRAGYVTVPVQASPEDIDRTVVYANPNAVGYRQRSPVNEPDDYRPNYPAVATPPPHPPPPPPPTSYSPYSMAVIQSLREELMEYILQYVHRRLNPYFQDPYHTQYQNPYYRNPLPLSYNPNYPNYLNPNYPPRNYAPRGYPPQIPPYPSPFVGAEPGLVPYPVPNFPFMNPNVQYSTQSSGGPDAGSAGESKVSAAQTAPPAKVIRGRSGYARRPYSLAQAQSLSGLQSIQSRESRENRRQPFVYRTLATGVTPRESSTIQAASSTTSSTTVVAPKSTPAPTPVRNIQILGTTPSPLHADFRPVTESPDEMEATS